MPTVIYVFEANPKRYVAQIGKERFIKSVAQDSGVPEAQVRSGMLRSQDVADLELVYPHFHRVVKRDGDGLLKVLT